VPIVLTAPYRNSPDDNRYAREHVTPTVAAFEDALGVLEGGRALAFASGMAAVTAVVEGRPAGSVAVVPGAGYTGALATFRAQEELGRMTVRRVDPTDTDSVISALDGADLLWLESVSNPLLDVPDLSTLLPAARAAGALACVDATFSTPLLLRALDLGADVVMHSVTKYLAGHSDVLMGALVTRSDELYDELHRRRTLTGSIPGALESYLAVRGLRTLALRMERAGATAAELAGRLREHAAVTRVRYPGSGAMISFEVAGGAAAAERVCAAVRLITHATSLGGVESLIERRAMHAGDAAFGTPEELLRLSVGIEHVEDLWADLAQALA
jgi:cystathionine gamma-synthase